MKYLTIVFVLVKAIQDQQQMIDRLLARVEQLEAMIVP